MRVPTPSKRRDTLPDLIGRFSCGSNNNTRSEVKFQLEDNKVVMVVEDAEGGAVLRMSREDFERFMLVLGVVAGRVNDGNLR